MVWICPIQTTNYPSEERFLKQVDSHAEDDIDGSSKDKFKYVQFI